MTEECGEIVFWTLRKKFVASSDEMPEHSSQVMYYSLAIGHHVGVIDCLNVAFRCPLTEYEDWLALVEEEQARRKMLGVMTFGEIVIDASQLNSVQSWEVKRLPWVRIKRSSAIPLLPRRTA